MLKNYFVLFYRNLRRQKLFSGVNLIGLTMGIVSTLVIYLYVRDNLNHDRFHTNADRIYRVNQTNIWNENDPRQLARTGPGVVDALKAELPEIEKITSIHTAGNFLVSYENPSQKVIAYDQENVLAAESNFFSMFSFQMMKGNSKSCLLRPQSVVITESTARKYFGDEEPLGKLLELSTHQNSQAFEVTGVIKDTPGNSYIDFDMLLSMNSFPKVKENSWSWIWTQLETFVLIDKNADIADVRAKLGSIPPKYAETTLQKAMNMSFNEYLKTGKSWELYLQPLTQIHLYSDNVIGNSNIVGNLKIVYALACSAIFILLLSCINFVNLSIAQFTRRIKEAGIRKVLGIGGKELVFGYFIEAFLFCLFALGIALTFTKIVLPWFSQLTGKTLEMNLGRDTGLAMLMIFLLFIMSILSGSLPAFFLKAFRPIEAIKGKLSGGKKGKGVRDGLVVLQFTVSIVLIICTAIVFQQLNFLYEKDLGFNKENLLVIDHVDRVGSGAAFTNEISNIPGVLNTSFCAQFPLRMGNDAFRPENSGDKDFILNFAAADENYLSTLGVQLSIGNDFDLDNPKADGVILNETAVKTLGWEMDESVIGRIIDYPNEFTKFEVIGVVRDYHFSLLEKQVEPMAIFNINSKVYSPKKFALVRIAPQNGKTWASIFDSLKTIWKEHMGDLPFKYEFIDQTFAAKLQSKQQFGNSLLVMAGLALLIACLGLLGMIIYTLELRTKEIGTRKILGASILNILILISRGYTKLVIVAFVIGAPLSYWLVQQWLQDFGNRITPSIWVFALAGVGTLLFSFLVTGYHSVKAAVTNPIEALKDE
ncbi:ABC transporter permease [Ulvibacterium sp.]|uniref:ABC transporter permease n=1 Tax=Ulvibacterium sp. TaxID=2665914 RepID=UPI003BAD3FE1